MIIQSMEEAINSFPSAMNTAKKLSGMTAVQIADLTGVPKSNIEKMVTGHLVNPNLYNTVAICKLFNFSIDEYFHISTSADSRIAEIAKEREELRAEIEELRREAQKVPTLQDYITSLKQTLNERADYLRLKDTYNKLMGCGLIVSVIINLVLLFIQ